jgi:Prolyl oligopeptidase, N-terminal beta-propeller domain
MCSIVWQIDVTGQSQLMKHARNQIRNRPVGAAYRVQLSPPVSPRREVVEVLHGETVSDPYRWLEDDQSPETQEWVAAQALYARSALNGIAERQAIRHRLDALFGTGESGGPVIRHGKYFYARRAADQQAASYFVREGLTGPERRLIDGVALDADEVLDDRIAPGLHDQVVVLGGDSAFLYTVRTPGGTRVMRHRLSTPESADTVVLPQTAGTDRWVWLTPSMTRDVVIANSAVAGEPGGAERPLTRPGADRPKVATPTP